MNTSDSDSLLSANEKGLSPLTKEASFEVYLKLLLVFCLLFSAYFSLAFIAQPISEANEFRQTQTALTSYYLVRNGFSLAYWTPVVGQGWSIPFEFPLYQELVARLSTILSTPLTNTGRVVSYLFSLLACIPIYATLKLLKYDGKTRLFCLTLFISSPLYMFWGSTFMIESTALFFTLCFCYYAIKTLVLPCGARDYLLTSIFLMLALLQKVTTALPPTVIFVVISSILMIRRIGLQKALWPICKAMLAIVPSIIVASLWTHYTDLVKLENPIGAKLTSSALELWNFGTIGQHFSADLWSGVIWDRVFIQNLLGPVGIAAIFGVFLVPNPPLRIFVLSLALAGLLPMLVFPWLHIVHGYYQCSNVVFLIVAVGVATFALTDAFLKKVPEVRGLLVAAFVASNLAFFVHDYMHLRTANINKNTRWTLRLADFIKSNTLPDESVIWYGFSWSSAPAFYSERKALTVPPWEGLEVDTIKHTDRYLKSPPAVIMLCPTEHSREILAAIADTYHPNFNAQVQFDHCLAIFTRQHTPLSKRLPANS